MGENKAVLDAIKEMSKGTTLLKAGRSVSLGPGHHTPLKEEEEEEEEEEGAYVETLLSMGLLGQPRPSPVEENPFSFNFLSIFFQFFLSLLSFSSFL